MTLASVLTRIFDADRAARDAEGELLESEQAELQPILGSAVDDALGMEDREEAILRLERLADLCGQVQGASMADALLRILGDDEPSVRYAAGEALLELGYDRYAELSRAIDRALESGLSSPAAAELPGILGEIGENSLVKQLRPFLQMSDPDAVAAAVEALAMHGDPAAVDLLSPLVDDSRVVALEGGESETETSIGDLVEDALSMLKNIGDSAGRDER